MSVIATIGLPADEFWLGSVLAVDPDLRIHLERVIPLGGSIVPYFWAADDALDGIQVALNDSPDIESFDIVDSLDGEVLVRVEWEDAEDALLDLLERHDGTILDAVGEAERWTMQLRFDRHEDLTAFYRGCVERGLTIDVKGVHNPGRPDPLGLGLDLTEVQLDTLSAALELGYFDVPRRINLVDLAAELGVSDTAVSQRLRRGIGTLLAASLPEAERRP